MRPAFIAAISRSQKIRAFELPGLFELTDPDDDEFLACADAAGVAVIVSGDKDLVDHNGWLGVRVLRPRQFVDEFLSDK